MKPFATGSARGRPVPVRLRLGPSRGLALALLAAHLGAVLAVLVVPIPAVVTAGMVSLLGASLAFHLRCHALRASAGAVLGVGIEGDGTLVLEKRGRPTLRCRWWRVACAHPRLTVLLAGSGLSTEAVVLAPGAAPREQLRRLRVRVLLEARRTRPPAQEPTQV
jgi:hypothetical protein